MLRKIQFYSFVLLGLVAVLAECFYLGNDGVDIAPSEGLMRRFFRWLGFVRPPIFGFSHYNHLDFGEPGELQNGIEFRYEGKN